MMKTRNIIVAVQSVSTHPWVTRAGSGLDVSGQKLSRMLKNPPNSVLELRKSIGTNVTQAYFTLPMFKIRLVPTHRATAASSWLAIPNIGQIVDMLPVHKKYAHANTTTELATMLPAS